MTIDGLIWLGIFLVSICVGVGLLMWWILREIRRGNF